MENLIKLIRSHGFDAVEKNGVIHATAPAWNSDGTPGAQTDEIQPTLSSVREWLGY